MRRIWDYPRRQRPDVMRRLAALDQGQQVVVLRSAAAVERFVAGLAERAA